MKKQMTIATRATLLSTALAASTLTWADSSRSAEELSDFLNNNPDMINVVAELEAQTGGTVEEVSFEEERAEQMLVEFEVALANGTEQDWLYRISDGSWMPETDHDTQKRDCDDNHDHDDQAMLEQSGPQPIGTMTETLIESDSRGI